MIDTHNFSINFKGKTLNLSTYDVFSSYYGKDGSTVEPQTRNWFSENVNKNDIVFDIGANIGLYTSLFSQLTENTYSFEPTDTYEKYLLPNLYKNNISNVKTFKLAISNKTGTFNEKIYMIWGQSPVSKNFDFITIDEFVNQNRVIPKYIKIDVDGFDLEVLQGATDTLKNNDITLCVEVNHALHTRGHKEIDINNFMKVINYEHFLTLDNENFFFKKIK